MMKRYSKNIKLLNTLPVYEDRYKKTKVRNGGKVYINFHGLNVQKMVWNVNLLQPFFIKSFFTFI